MNLSTFDAVIDRRGTESTKWDRLRVEYGDERLLPLWLADMDFPTSNAIQQALIRRAMHPIYGYTDRGPLYPKLFAERFSSRFSTPLEHENVVLSTGVMYSITAALTLFTAPGDKILIPRPCYRPFVTATVSSGRIPAFADMPETPSGFVLDWDVLDRVARECRAVIICNPHNPTGRILSKEELEGIVNLAERHDLIVISDEIHADFSYHPDSFIPIANLGESIRSRLVSCVAPTKSFNLAGLKVSAAFLWNPSMLRRFREHATTIGISSINLFAMEAVKAAYRDSQEWQDALLRYLSENRNLVRQFVNEHGDRLSAHVPEGTYFYWIRINGMRGAYETLIREAHVALGNGTDFHPNATEYVRLNFACPKSTLIEALRRIDEFLRGGMPTPA